MSLIGLLTATEKQVHQGQLHMKLIQWPLKNNWRVPETLEKVIPIPRSLHPHLQWWLKEDNVLTGQPLHPIKYALQIFRHINRRMGLSLRRAHCKRNLVPSGKQAAYKLSRTKSSLSGFKRVPRPLLKQDSSFSNRQYHSSVIHKQGRRHEVGPTLCPTMENLDLVYHETSDSKPRHIPGRLNVVADKLSRLCQNIQTEWFLKIDLFPARFNNKLPLFVSPIPDPLATAVDALSLPW